MTPKQAIAHWSNQTTLARVLGVTRQAVQNWKKRGRIPLRVQLTLHEMSSGALKVESVKRLNGKSP